MAQLNDAIRLTKSVKTFLDEREVDSNKTNNLVARVMIQIIELCLVHIFKCMLRCSQKQRHWCAYTNEEALMALFSLQDFKGRSPCPLS